VAADLSLSGFGRHLLLERVKTVRAGRGTGCGSCQRFTLFLHRRDAVSERLPGRATLRAVALLGARAIVELQVAVQVAGISLSLR
jgi:hypothetical protein